MSRRRGPGLLRTMGRAAVISSTATAASRATNNAMDRKAMQAQQNRTAAMQTQLEMEQMKAQLAEIQAVQAQPAAVAPAAPTTAPQTDLLAQLQQLAQLKDAGALTEEEFQIAKGKILS